MSNYNQKSFEYCVFNPMVSEAMLSAYPILYEIMPDDINCDPWKDYILRYTIMVYDPKSALVISERDLNFRKGIAAELSGFPMDSEQMEAIYNCSHPGIVELTCKYLLRFVRSKEWAAICAFEFKTWEAIKLIMQPISSAKSDKEQLDAANKKEVLAASIDQGLEKLDQYYNKFFGEDSDLIGKAKKRMTPELMAAKSKQL